MKALDNETSFHLPKRCAYSNSGVMVKSAARGPYIIFKHHPPSKMNLKTPACSSFLSTKMLNDSTEKSGEGDGVRRRTDATTEVPVLRFSPALVE